MIDEITTRRLNLAELTTLIRWAAAEGWNPGLSDSGAFFKTDRKGYYGTFVNQQLVAGISLVTHDADHAFLGLYLCHPDWRGQGMGWKVWQAALAAVDHPCIGLDGVVAQQDNYQRSGFTPGYRHIRHAGSLSSEKIETLRANLPAESLQRPCKVRQVTSASDSTKLIALDHETNGYSRKSYLQTWLQPDPYRFSMLSENERGEIDGLITLRQCEQGYKIGPLYAPTLHTALTLLKEAVIHQTQKTGNPESLVDVMIDTPEPNQQACDLARSLQLNPVFETCRMYRGAAPEVQNNQIYSVTTLELG